MTWPIPRDRNGWRGVQLAFVALALAVKLVVPAGFMVGSPKVGAGFPLVLCTSQGMVVIAAKDGIGQSQAPDKAPDNKSDHDHPCAFGGHGVVAAPALALLAAPVEFARYRIMPVARAPSLAPGRGLAAPPLPARGPPPIS